MPTMKEPTLLAVALAALCVAGCERTDRNERTDRADVNDAAEPGPSRAGQPVAVDAESREIAEQGGRDPEASPNAPGVVSPASPNDLVDRAREARSEFVAAARRRLDQVERELQQAEQRSRERGTELRGELREEKRRLDADLERMGEETEDAWSQMKDGFADALDRFETKVRQVRKDIDPDA
jgi:hypothetical protein